MTNTIPLNDISRIHAPLLHDFRLAIDRVMQSSWFLRGKETAQFEAEWAEFCGQSYCVACGSGTDALTLAAMALGLREVTIQANTLPLTAIGLHRAGVDVHLADIDETGRMLVAPANGVPVLLYGRMPSRAEETCQLFDAAHAHGWQPGSNAVACWSFYPTKTLGALGDAGAITTNDQGLADLMRDLSGRDDILRDGRQMTSRMDEIQAAILRVKLRALPAWIMARQEIGRHYASRLPPGIKLVSDTDRDLHHLAVIHLNKRDELASFLKEQGVETKIHFPLPLHRQSAPWGRAGLELPGTEQWCEKVLTLPCFPGLSTEELNLVIDAVTRFSEARR